MENWTNYNSLGCGAVNAVVCLNNFVIGITLHCAVSSKGSDQVNPFSSCDWGCWKASLRLSLDTIFSAIK